MPICRGIAGLLVSAGTAIAQPEYYEQYFSDLDTVSVTGVSESGHTVVAWRDWGLVSHHGIRWTPESGAQEFGTIAPSFTQEVRVYGVSAGGRFSVGTSSFDPNDYRSRAATLIDADGEPTPIFLQPGVGATAQVVSIDGTVVYGSFYPTVTGPAHFFRWRQGTVTDLGTMPSFIECRAISEDGSLVAGIMYDGVYADGRAFRWSEASGFVTIPHLSTGTRIVPMRIAVDGITVIGFANDQDGWAIFQQAGGGEAVPVIRIGSGITPMDTSMDGSTVVGFSGGVTAPYAPLFWRSATGVVNVKTLMRAAGFAHVNIGLVHRVSPDGRVMAGSGPGPGGNFICIAIPGGCTANVDQSTTPPVLNVNDFVAFLGYFGQGSTRANCDGSTVGPVLNANDFQCFLNQFAAGCP